MRVLVTGLSTYWGGRVAQEHFELIDGLEALLLDVEKDAMSRQLGIVRVRFGFVVQKRLQQGEILVRQAQGDQLLKRLAGMHTSIYIPRTSSSTAMTESNRVSIV